MTETVFVMFKTQCLFHVLRETICMYHTKFKNHSLTDRSQKRHYKRRDVKNVWLRFRAGPGSSG